MKLLFVIDGRSPIATNWVRYFCDQGHEVHLVSTFPCQTDLHLASFHILPVAFSSAEAKNSPRSSNRRKNWIRWLIPLGARLALRQWLGPLTISPAASKLRQIITQVQPDLVHAMRIPFEGMLSAMALQGYTAPSTEPIPPLLISVWGNDFTLHAPSSPLMKRYTRLALTNTSALHADCQRDIDLAFTWGLHSDKPVIVLPGAGGVHLDLFYPSETASSPTPKISQPQHLVINPRGFRAYIQNQAFFQAIPLVLERFPDTQFVCPSMAEHPQASHWVDDLGIQGSVELLPKQSPAQMADLFRKSQVTVSPSTHDGTPNTLLEAMACGCFPIAGDIQSLREWITPGVNGLLVDPRKPQALAEAIVQAIENEALRVSAAEYNTRLIINKAEYNHVMQAVLDFYQSLC